MKPANKFAVLNIRDYLENDEKRLGEKSLEQLLSEFSCPINPDIERFLKESSIEFVKKHQAVTYLVLSLENAELLGYFSFAIKPLAVKADSFSNTVKRKFSRFSKLDKNQQSFNLAAYLIAQLGKNYNEKLSEHITGQELLEMAIDQAKLLQYQAGGVVVFVEADDKDKVLSFYKNYGFKCFDTRQTSSATTEQHNLVQLLRLL